MTTTKRSTFGAGLRTTILLATLSGLFVAIGFLIGGSSTALLFLFLAFTRTGKAMRAVAVVEASTGRTVVSRNADSQRAIKDANVESLANLKTNLAEIGITLQVEPAQPR